MITSCRRFGRALSPLLAILAVLATPIPAASDEPETPAASSPPPDPPPPPHHFGDKGDFVVTGASDIELTSESYSASPASNFAAIFSPGLDYFLIRNFSLGVSANIGFTRSKGYDPSGDFIQITGATVALAPRVGLNVPLGDHFSFYPRLAIGPYYSTVAVLPVAANPLNQGQYGDLPPASGSYGLSVDAFLPFLFHPTTHFFVGVGPRVATTVPLAGAGTYASLGPNGQGSTTLDAEIVLGGTWGRGVDPPEPEATASTEPEDAGGEATEDAGTPRHFGSAYQWVFTAESGASFIASKTPGGTSSVSANFNPGFDYFIANQFSLGINAFAQRESTSTLGGQNSTDGYGLAIHTGVNVPFNPWLSLYIRGYFGAQVGHEWQSQPVSATWVALFVPLLVHPAPHFFFGLGPNVLRDTTRWEGPTINLATIVSANLMIGGWL